MKKRVILALLILLIVITGCDKKEEVEENTFSFNQLAEDYNIGKSYIGEEIIIKNVPVQSKEDQLLGKVTYGVVCSNIGELRIPEQGNLTIKGTVGDVTGEYSIYLLNCETK